METSNEHTAKVTGKDLSISTKQAIEICKFIKGKKLKKSKQMLQRVLDKKQAVPFTRYNRDRGHRPGNMSSGAYPQKSTKAIMDLLDSVESNAQNKGLDTEQIVIKSIIPNRASRPPRFGRRRGIKAKRTHIEIIVEEVEEKKTKEQPKKQEHKEEKKVVEKPKVKETPQPKKQEVKQK